MIETGLKEKVVIITGGSAGIGRATALRFAEEGAKVAVWDVSKAGEKELGKALLDAGAADIVFDVVDVTNSEAVDSAAGATANLWGGIDVLINNAGIVRDAQLVKVKDGEVVSTMDDATFDAVIAVNLKGVFACTRAVVPHMIQRGGGAILSASSVVGLYGNFGQSNYAATKAGVINMTRTWSRELGRYGIRANAIAPGFVGTEILEAMPEKVLNSIVGRTPLGRVGTPREIAEAYVFLASDAAAFISGTVLSVDGGLVIGT